MTADWAMVIITAIYVGATIVIMVANHNTAKAAKEQLAEMKKEHDENVRIQVMPYLRFRVGEHLKIDDMMLPSIIIQVNELESPSECVGLMTAIEVSNIGQGLATNICFSWDDMESIQSLPVDYLRCNEKKCDSYSFVSKRGTAVGVTERFNMTFYFSDILGNEYSQKLTLNAFARENSLEIKMVNAGTPVLEDASQYK